VATPEDTSKVAGFQFKLAYYKQRHIPNVKLLDIPDKVRSLAPMSGEHTEEILASFGYSEQRINELRQEGAIG